MIPPVKTITPAFSDARGDIIDVLEGEVHHTGIITFAKDAIRANHFHRKQTQYTYVLTGKIELRMRPADNEKAEIMTSVMGPGAFAEVPPNTVHAYKALEPSSMICLTTKERGSAEAYEEDTVRVPSLF